MSTNIDHITEEELRKAVGIVSIVEDRAYEVARMMSICHDDREGTEFEADRIHVALSKTRCGDTDVEYFSVPYEWLWRSDEWIAARIADDKAAEKAAKEVKDAEAIQRKKEATEKAELANYERLRAKYGPKTDTNEHE